MRLALALLIAKSNVIAQFDVGSNAAELLQQAEDALNDFLEENDIEDFFGDEEYFDYDGEYTDNDDGDEEYDEDYEEEYDEEYDEQYDGEFDDNYDDYYADWYEEWEGWGDNDWKDYWYQPFMNSWIGLLMNSVLTMKIGTVCLIIITMVILDSKYFLIR